MYDPPPGFADCDADGVAAGVPENPVYRIIDVPRVGEVKARLPLPSAIPLLAGASNGATNAQERLTRLNAFVHAHLEPGELDELVCDMINPDTDLPADTILRVSRAIATQGTGRPYGAVINLALRSAHNWRTLRERALKNGIGNLMDLSSMHGVLDMMEQLGLEAATSGSKSEIEAEQKIANYYNVLYKPDPLDIEVGEDGVEAAPPPGFEEDEMDAAFDGFMAAVGGE